MAAPFFAQISGKLYAPFSGCFMVCLGISEKERDCPDTCKRYQRINNTAEETCLTAKKGRYNVVLKKTDASPVERANDYQSKYDSIHHNNISILNCQWDSCS